MTTKEETTMHSLIFSIDNIVEKVKYLKLDERIEVINQFKMKLHEISPFILEPVDCVIWIKNDQVHANDYNPNSVAPPEMELLRVSIQEDGFTQPVVTMLESEGTREVIDGFHRNRVSKECADITERLHGYLPVVTINDERTNKGDRIASTIRHNRARGKHKITAMSDIVMDLKKRNWSDEKIAKNLGMDSDEILRLCQIGGISELFSNAEFSKSWNPEMETYEDEIEP